MISNSGIHVILDVVGMVSEDEGKDDGRQQQDDSTTVPCILEDFGIIASGFQEKITISTTHEDFSTDHKDDEAALGSTQCPHSRMRKGLSPNVNVTKNLRITR